ncbi:hypothetical protein NL676_023744 [Syzygium grande]|nr:hypothetical protein NL676_023744 [Syzygium grande]
MGRSSRWSGPAAMFALVPFRPQPCFGVDRPREGGGLVRRRDHVNLDRSPSSDRHSPVGRRTATPRPASGRSR